MMRITFSFWRGYSTGTVISNMDIPNIYHIYKSLLAMMYTCIPEVLIWTGLHAQDKDD